MATPALKRLGQAAARFRRSGRDVETLDRLLARAAPAQGFGERLQWLADLTRWVVRPGPVGGEPARTVLASPSLLGPTPFFAALTGVLLYASSRIAGWADNWFAFRGLEGALGGHRRLSHALGVSHARRFAHWLRESVSGLASNVSLGFLLGMTPALGRFLGLPLDVRHVTLSAGFLAAAVSSLGSANLDRGSLPWALGGLLSMAIFNVGVSFALALGTAVRALAARARAFRHPRGVLAPPAPPSGGLRRARDGDSADGIRGIGPVLTCRWAIISPGGAIRARGDRPEVTESRSPR